MLSAGYSPTVARQGTIRVAGEGRKVPPADHPVVSGYLRDFQSQAVKRTSITLDTIVQRLDGLYHQALVNEQIDQARLATMDLAKVLGLVVERKQLTVKRIEEMSEAELMQVIGEPVDVGSELH